MSPANDFVILSGAYVSAEMVVEFGRLPPAFLPFGMKRLYEPQVAFARARAQRVFMTLPEDYPLANADRRRLAAEGVTIIRSDPALGLADAIQHALNVVEPEGVLRLLHGDTLVAFEEGEHPHDLFAAGSTDHYAVWAEYAVNEDGRTLFREALSVDNSGRSIVCGYFSFEDGALYRRLISEGGSFVGSLNAYSSQRNLAPKQTSRWFDFGHLHTYFHSRQADLLARHFNSVEATRFSVRKRGTPERKIYAEAKWFEQAPVVLRPFLPQFYGAAEDDQVSYELEYLFLGSLSELFVFGQLPAAIWNQILASCRDFHSAMAQVRPTRAEVPAQLHTRFFDDMIVAKSHRRMERFAADNGVSLDREWTINGAAMPGLTRVIDTMVSLAAPTGPGDIAFWHGDFHFANLMYDFRGNRVKAFDPRGMLDDGSLSLFGDLRYDVAKLTHSVIGLYDYLIAGRYRLETDGHAFDLAFDLPDVVPEVQRNFRNLGFTGGSPGSAPILALTALLFLSMLPLHADSRERQMAMLANGLRLAKLAEDVA